MEMLCAAGHTGITRSGDIWLKIPPPNATLRM
jgi:hypothetical protein